MSESAGSGHPTLALTGATGFVGTRLLARLRATHWRVRALYRPRRRRALPDLPGVEWIPGDLANAGALARLVAGTDAVIHCAGAVRGATRAHFERTNVEGTRQLAEAVARAPDCRRFLLLSSLAGRAPELSDYAWSKRESERTITVKASGLEWTVLRPPAVFGPGDRELLALFRAIEHGFAPVPGGAYRRFSLLYVDDLASAMVSWLAAGAGCCGTYELDDGRAGGYDWDTFTRIAAGVLRGSRPLRRIRVPVSVLRCAAWGNYVAARMLGYAPMLTPGKVRELTYIDWVSSSSAFSRATGWRPAFGLERGLVCTFGSAAALSREVS